MGDLSGAIRSMQEATRLAPANAPVQHDLGYLCLQAGRYGEAIVALRNALRVDPNFAQASLYLGIALQEQGDLPAALLAYRRAVFLQPQSAAAQVCLGALLESIGDAAAAVATFRAGADADPGSRWGQLAHARALFAADRDIEAEPVLRALHALDPNDAMVDEMLAALLANTGRFEEAHAHFASAIAAVPKLAGSYYDLVRCRRITRDDTALLAQMESALRRPESDTDARSRIHLALGKALDDLDDPAAAMRHFDQADALRQTLSPFDPNVFEARVERLIGWFTPERLAQLSRDAAAAGAAADRGAAVAAVAAGAADAGAAADRDAAGAAAAGAAAAAAAAAAAGSPAVLIMGLPRSGTTLLEQILSAHPEAHGAGEQPFWVTTGPKWEESLTRDAGSFDLAGVREQYLTLLRNIAPQATRVIDKMPLNILWAGLIHLTLPGATLIHCRRSPIDTALSIHRTYFNPRLSFPTGGSALVAAIRAVERLTAHWRRVLPSDRYIEVDYERLVQAPRFEVEKLLAACGLAWNEACLQPERNTRLIKTPSKWQARQPIHRGAIDSWRRYQPWLGELAALV